MISKERALLAEDMAGFEAINGEAVKNYMMESGGQPVRAMVTTTWRSGSTFLGDIMTSHPGTFYHYEPLLHYDIVQARTGPLAEDAVRTLSSLMRCNYTSLGRTLSLDSHLTSSQDGTSSTASSTSGSFPTTRDSGPTAWLTGLSLESPTAGTRSSSTPSVLSSLSSR